MAQVWVSIGNSDNKLSQQDWSMFCAQLVAQLNHVGTQFYGEWHSLPNARWQNMVASAEIPDSELDDLRRFLRKVAGLYDQDSVALMTGVTEFITPTTAEG